MSHDVRKPWSSELSHTAVNLIQDNCLTFPYIPRLNTVLSVEIRHPKAI